MIKPCEWCKKEFEAKTERARLCGRKCEAAKYRSKNHNKALAATRRWRQTNPEKVKLLRKAYYKKSKNTDSEKRKSRYDQGQFLSALEYRRQYLAKMKLEEPDRWNREREKARERARACYARKKQEAARAAYLADPINAARIAAANLSRMTPEERDRWLDKQEQEREKQERKAKREALKKEIAAQSVTVETVKEQFGEVFDLEWSDKP